ncbi:MAG: radical SAM protein [Desulfobacterales bacterium]|nr:radical SAM protein [Desulfobacterales bacterium]
MKEYDCVIIGHYESDFNGFANRFRLLSEQSGAYHEALTNSIRMNGIRVTNTDLLNAGLESATGKKWDLNPFKIPHLGVFYLTSFLRKRGIRTEFINSFNFDESTLSEKVSKAYTVAITTTYYLTDESIVKLVRYIRSCSQARIIIGGPRIFRIYQDTPAKIRRDTHLKSIGADIYVIDSQGELTLSRVVKAITEEDTNLKRIPNIIFREKDGTMCETVREPEKNDMNTNAVQWSLFKENEYAPTVNLRTTRSCPFSCEFCSYPSFAGTYTLVDTDVLENEFRYLSEHGVRNIVFIDDTFNVPLPRFKDLLRRIIKNKFNFRWVSYFRTSVSDEETYDLMAESGCIAVYLGIESADQELLNKMNKHAKAEQYRKAITGLLKRNIMTLASLVIGFPGENENSIKKTIELLQETRSTFYALQLYFYDTLTPIYSKREEYGLQGAGFGWSHNTMDWKEAIHWKEYIIRNVTNSINLPFFGMNIWSLPYFLEKGLPMELLLKFFEFNNSYLRASLDNDKLDISSQMESLTNLLSKSLLK